MGCGASKTVTAESTGLSPKPSNFIKQTLQHGRGGGGCAFANMAHGSGAHITEFEYVFGTNDVTRQQPMIPSPPQKGGNRSCPARTVLVNAEKYGPSSGWKDGFLTRSNGFGRPSRLDTSNHGLNSAGTSDHLYIDR